MPPAGILRIAALALLLAGPAPAAIGWLAAGAAAAPPVVAGRAGLARAARAAAPWGGRPAGAGAETAFVAGLEDLPLMPGLAEVAGTATVFDAPQGRIVETFAAGAVSADDIKAFYGQTLPQLGWTASAGSGAGPVEFRREGERLVLEITPGAKTTVVRFTLAPQ